MPKEKAKPAAKRTTRGRKSARTPDRTLLSLREYSAHRRNLGVPGSVFAIQAAIRAGKISRTCVQHERCPAGCKDAKIDPHQADLEWDAWTDTTRLAASARPATIAEAQLECLVWQARKARQTVEEKEQILIHVAEVRAVAFREHRNLRDALLQLSRRLAGRIVTMRDRRQVETVIHSEIVSALKALDKEALGKHG